ncbi:uncharacterized protein BCR38DRAFT_471033 [Pseudomassariella vexata]|uniref:Uncharacterized protein n=1 Tax=Pseudomassariella vexata TaxID=1141098 RepID=A0A1Y2EE58_9PEZI|nr:uncharacterized protein BCR38DRAFT_471033 [Pseudomassariella vexata]ORY69546.1 hypothetical protein BCR38DRAFT_471033 [Pseudomassariella vexata]
MMYYGTSSMSSKSPYWDPETVLELIHPLRHAVRCTGIAPSKRRRCMNQVASFSDGRRILDNLARTMDATQAAESPDLKNAASSTLCYLHGDQYIKVARQWSSLLRAWQLQNKTSTLKSDSDTTPLRRTKAAKPFAESIRVKVEDDDGLAKTERDRQWEAIEAMMKKLGINMQDVLDDMERKQWDREARKHEKREDERKKRQEFEQEKRDRARQEKERQEKERQEKERQEKERQEKERQEQRKAEEEKKRKEKEAREEAIRERARIAREKRAKEAREKAEKEAQEWAQAWKRYCKAWNRIETDLYAKFSEDDVPWPVRSGLLADVNEVDVKTFFRKAPPGCKSGRSDVDQLSLKKEILRWHTDKILHRLGPEVCNGKQKESLRTIAAVMIKLRQEAAKTR